MFSCFCIHPILSVLIRDITIQDLSLGLYIVFSYITVDIADPCFAVLPNYSTYPYLLDLSLLCSFLFILLSQPTLSNHFLLLLLPLNSVPASSMLSHYYKFQYVLLLIQIRKAFGPRFLIWVKCRPGDTTYVGGLIIPLLIYMPFVYLVRSSDS